MWLKYVGLRCTQIHVCVRVYIYRQMSHCVHSSVPVFQVGGSGGRPGTLAI